MELFWTTGTLNKQTFRIYLVQQKNLANMFDLIKNAYVDYCYIRVSRHNSFLELQVSLKLKNWMCS